MAVAYTCDRCSNPIPTPRQDNDNPAGIISKVQTYKHREFTVEVKVVSVPVTMHRHLQNQPTNAKREPIETMQLCNQCICEIINQQDAVRCPTEPGSYYVLL